MHFPVIFDVAIGIVVIYFISSLILSFVMEFVIVRRNWRGDFLYNKLSNMFYSSQGGFYNIIEKVYRHPLISKMQQYAFRRPEQIDSAIFSKAFVQVLKEVGKEYIKCKPKEEFEKEDQKSKVENEPKEQKKEIIIPITESLHLALENEKYLDGDGKRLVESFLIGHETDPEKINTNIQEWFIGFQSRLDYLFKREVKWYLFFYSLAFCVLANIDTIKIYQKLTVDEKARGNMIVMAEGFTSVPYDSIKNRIFNDLQVSLNKMVVLKDSLKNSNGVNVPPTDTSGNQLSQVNDTTIIKIIQELEASIQKTYGDGYELIGWTKKEINELFKGKDIKVGDKAVFSNIMYELFFKLIGILISAFALMYGAPFWYEYMKSMLAIRKVINPNQMTTKS